MSTARKLGISLAILVLSVPLLRVSGWFGIGIPIGLVLSILYWMDLGRQLRAEPDAHGKARVLGLLMGVPEALFGAAALCIGLAIVAWVLYNSFWQQDPHYNRGFLTFGIAPLLVLFGAGLLLNAFRRPRKRLDELLAVEFDEQEVRIRVLEELSADWNQQFAWSDVERVCFKDAGLYDSDVLFVTVRDRPKPAVILAEAKGFHALVGALSDKGLFPEEVWRRAFGDTSGGLHCWPPQTKEV